MFIEVAVVDSEELAAKMLINMLDRFSIERNMADSKTSLAIPGKTEGSPLQFKVTHFKDGVSFLNNYMPRFDVVFMDIIMKDMDGFTVAKKLRELDKGVILIFVTEMASYAIKGYEVGALDFIIKPVIYEHLKQVINRIMPVIEKNSKIAEITIKHETGFERIKIDEIRYAEVTNHTLIYHLNNKTTRKAYGTLSTAERNLGPFGFASCNRCYLVNMHYVMAVDKFTVTVGDEKLQISRPQRKEFMQTLATYLGGAYK